MTTLLRAIIVLAVFAAGVTSCKKNGESSIQVRLQYQLYTDSNFSNDNGIIRFRAQTWNKNQLLFDSALAPMRIKDIPSKTSSITFFKTLTISSAATLRAGFTYEIEDVGSSWYFDSIPAGRREATVKFAFR